MTHALPASPIAGITAIELTSQHVSALARFFAANPAYFLAVQGEPARPDDAREEIEEALPEGIPHTRKWVIGYVRPDGEIVALVNLVSDILRPRSGTSAPSSSRPPATGRAMGDGCTTASKPGRFNWAPVGFGWAW
jgi:hypothetical protein